MKSRVRIFLAALATAVGLLAASGAYAQPHLDPPLESVNVPTPEQDVWVRRLVGNYKLDGMVGSGDCTRPDTCVGISGKMDCIAVGDGPGVQCVFKATWNSEIFTPFLEPAMSLFGLDPGRHAINLMLVNDRGLPTKGFGTVKGHVGKFKTLCGGANEDGCQVGIIIEAKPDARLNYMWMGDTIVIAMRRVSPEEFKALGKKSRQAHQ
jgi:hypothetical protein